jgi:hypothetical protein
LLQAAFPQEINPGTATQAGILAFYLLPVRKYI